SDARDFLDPHPWTRNGLRRRSREGGDHALVSLRDVEMRLRIRRPGLLRHGAGTVETGWKGILPQGLSPAPPRAGTHKSDLILREVKGCRVAGERCIADSLDVDAAGGKPANGQFSTRRMP